MLQSNNDHDQLSGVRVLVVEDDPLLATDLDGLWSRRARWSSAAV